MKRIFLHNAIDALEKYAQSVIVKGIIFRKDEALTKKCILCQLIWCQYEAHSNYAH